MQVFILSPCYLSPNPLEIERTMYSCDWSKSLLPQSPPPLPPQPPPPPQQQQQQQKQQQRQQ